MTASEYLFEPPPVRSLPVRGEQRKFPVNRLFFVGRNYHAHAREMGRPVDKSVERPFYFTKSIDTLTLSGATTPYPPSTKNYHFEMELVVAIGKPGFRVLADKAAEIVYGYAAGLDMTRRDVQLEARDKGRPWDLGKDVEHSSVCSEIVPMEGQIVSKGAIVLSVNGATKQSSDVAKLIWDIPEIIADLSQFYHLQAGDLIYTGTPEGVAAVLPGDKIEGSVEGIAEVGLTVGNVE
ncbi:FAA hydrolase [Hyaloraphidium curvatum]|nr:FAA hydrolase [Hyaloraphidium curvatum]